MKLVMFWCGERWSDETKASFLSRYPTALLDTVPSEVCTDYFIEQVLVMKSGKLKDQAYMAKAFGVHISEVEQVEQFAYKHVWMISLDPCARSSGGCEGFCTSRWYENALHEAKSNEDLFWSYRIYKEFLEAA